MNYMQRALELAQQGRYTCSPNPMVGCVIVRGDNIVGEGFHRKAGEAHAEILALQQAGELAEGATVYVTLEPCCHVGKTGPCVEALIAAKISKVIIACSDLNPKVSGKGIKRLRDAGITVQLGELSEQAQQLNAVFFHYIKTNLPFVALKWAMSIDGKINTAKATSKQITSEAAKQHTHELRQSMAAILVGSGTVLADDPQLTVRLENTVAQPVRIVLDSRGRCPIESKIFSNALPGKTIVATLETASKQWLNTLENTGIDVLILPALNNQVNLNSLLKELAQREISSVLVEGGSEIHASFLQQDLVQRIYAYVAPKIIGGKDNLSAVGGAELELNDWQFKTIASLNPDVLLVAEKLYKL